MRLCGTRRLAVIIPCHALVSKFYAQFGALEQPYARNHSSVGKFAILWDSRDARDICGAIIVQYLDISLGMRVVGSAKAAV